jgi:anti-anti-sigma regulatory factor
MLKTHSYGDVLVISVAADKLDSVEQVAAFTRRLKVLLAEQPETHWLIDFGNTTFFITPAVNTLLAILRTLRLRNGQLVLTGMSADVLHILGLMRVDRVLTLRPTRSAGLEVLGIEDADQELSESA